MQDLLKTNGNLLTYEEFQGKYNVHTNFLEFAGTRKSVENFFRRCQIDINNEPIFMPPTSKKLTEHIGFGLSILACVHLSKTVRARVLKFHIWIPHGKIADTRFFFFLSCPSYLPFWSYAPLKKSE